MSCTVPPRPVDLEHDLRGATGRGELSLVYQPIVTVPDGRIVGLEALIRWNHPTRGLIPPAVLIPLAERSRLIVDIGRWVLDQSRTDQDRWCSSHARELNVAVNVSADQLLSAGFARSVADVLATARNGSDSTLEITEHVIVDDPERALTVLRELKGMGVKIALDDFGTGYSSLSFLSRYPVNSLKVGPEFIVATGPAGGAIIAAVLGLARELGIEVVAEGVETVEQLDQLTALACELGQGFYFTRPMSSAALDSLMQRCTNGDLHLPMAAARPCGMIPHRPPPSPDRW